VNDAGNSFVAGTTTGVFPGFSHSTSFTDAFIAKYDSNGNQTWLKQFGTNADDELKSISVDPQGNVFVAGYTAGEFGEHHNTGGYEAFLAKYDSSGNQAWLKEFGTSRDDSISDVVADGNGNVVVVGNTEGVFDAAVTPGSVIGFMAKYDANGQQTWLKQFGPGNAFGRQGVAMDGNGNIVVAGGVSGALEGQTTLGDGDAVVAKYNTNGDQLWLRQFGTNGLEGAYGVAVDAANRVIVSGVTYGTFPGFSNLSGANGFVSNGADGFVTQFDSSGNQLWLKQFGTNQYDFVFGVAVSSNGHVYVGGTTEGAFDEFNNPGSSNPFINSFTLLGAQR
jgi:hypothetical protein